MHFWGNGLREAAILMKGEEAPKAALARRTGRMPVPWVLAGPPDPGSMTNAHMVGVPHAETRVEHVKLPTVLFNQDARLFFDDSMTQVTPAHHMHSRQHSSAIWLCVCVAKYPHRDERRRRGWCGSTATRQASPDSAGHTGKRPTEGHKCWRHTACAAPSADTIQGSEQPQ